MECCRIQHIFLKFNYIKEVTVTFEMQNLNLHMHAFVESRPSENMKETKRRQGSRRV